MISNEAPASKDASAHSASPRCAKWHYMYFVIAALGIAAISASLGFSREIIVDSGIGMSEEQKSRLFRSFTQADYSTTRKFGGTGLGLTISKTLVNLMGGEILVSSVPGLGSCFEFSLPTGSLENVEIIADPSEVNLGENVDESVEVTTKVAANVLLVEDGIDNRRLISFYLKKTGCQVTTVENG